MLRFFKSNKFIFTILTAILLSLFNPARELSFATDEAGCLICHKYPGLVGFDKTTGIKVLHIDENKYLASSHGKVDCRKCHVTVVKVPHTGETKVDCTTECHLSNKDKQMIESYDLSILHKKEQSYITSLNDESSCRHCHPLYPHSENKLVRALLNMHTGFMICEVCHIKRDKFLNLTYDWTESENAKFGGEPFGSFFNPKTAKALKSDSFISRISVCTIEKGQKRSLMNTWDTKNAELFMSEKETMEAEVKEQRLEYFHEGINKKEISVACNECHSSNSILDFKQLGFDDKKTKALISLDIKGLVTKYKTFYFPNLFKN